jgi:hypothetical protein
MTNKRVKVTYKRWDSKVIYQKIIYVK